MLRLNFKWYTRHVASVSCICNKHSAAAYLGFLRVSLSRCCDVLELETYGTNYRPSTSTTPSMMPNQSTHTGKHTRRTVDHWCMMGLLSLFSADLCAPFSLYSSVQFTLAHWGAHQSIIPAHLCTWFVLQRNAKRRNVPRVCARGWDDRR